MKTIIVTIEKSADHYSAYAENYTGIYGAGNSVKEVKDNILQSIELQKKTIQNFEIKWKFDIQSFLNYYGMFFSMPALEKLTGINQKQLHHYAMGIKIPRPETKRKIEKGLHRLGEELVAFEL